MEANKEVISKDHEKNIIVSYDNKQDTYIFYNDRHEQIGTFNVDQLIKVLIEDIDTYKQIYRNTDVSSINRETLIVFVFKIDAKAEICLRTYSESAFMGDIEMIIKLNKSLHDIEKNKLENLLEKVDVKLKKKIKLRIQKFIYMLINHTLGIISIMSGYNISKEVADKLLYYSISLVYRVSQFVESELENNMKSFNNLLIMNDKYDELQKEISTNINLLDQNLINKDNRINELENLVNEYRRKEIETISYTESHTPKYSLSNDATDATDTYSVHNTHDSTRSMSHGSDVWSTTSKSIL